MAQTILVTSGKGGVGKSIVCAALGEALAAVGRRVLLVEGARRSLDVIFGVADRVVYDLSDVMSQSCTSEEAQLVAGASGRLWLICAPANATNAAEAKALEALMETLESQFDYILIEADGADCDKLEAYAAAADRAVIVSTADQVSARAARHVSDALFAAGLRDIRLCVNMLPLDFAKRRPVQDLDWMIDNVCAQLIAVVLFDQTMQTACSGSGLHDLSNISKTIFDNFAQRIEGNYIDLLVQ